MNEIIGLITNYNTEVILGLAGISLLLLILNIISQVRISKIKTNYDAIVKGVERENLEIILLDIKQEVKDLTGRIGLNEENIKDIKDKMKFAVQKVEVLRYNAFSDLGGDQSFSVIILDENNSGFVLTNIYSRDYSNSYIKPITEGRSKYKLSKEETEVLNRAMK